jgi:hypothetical protein
MEGKLLEVFIASSVIGMQLQVKAKGELKTKRHGLWKRKRGEVITQPAAAILPCISAADTPPRKPSDKHKTNNMHDDIKICRI